jgi:hypothetical protein
VLPVGTGQKLPVKQETGRAGAWLRLAVLKTEIAVSLSNAKHNLTPARW